MIAIVCEVRVINQAVQRNLYNGGGGVYCQEQDGSLSRICRAKTVQGVLLVRRLHDGEWIVPVQVMKEW